MPRELCHRFFQDFQNDPALGHYFEHVYTQEGTDRYFDTNSRPNRKLFAVMVDDQVVGECKLKNIDFQKQECTLGIHMQNDSVKGMGYGTQAERLVLQYAFQELGMAAVNADTVLQNTRSQHVLEKAGFRYTHEDETFKYYRCEVRHPERDPMIHQLLGQNVHVVIDRPVGYQHGDICYPVNYGYIPGLMAEDGEEQDVYILGVTEPISEFDGQVIGAIRRMNDCEDKLVAAPTGMRFHQGQIAEAVHFQEQYFCSTIDSLFRKSCGVIPYRRNHNQKEYLILLQTNNCWSFPKGHMEALETEEQTALRELHEETGLHAALIPGKRITSEYPISPSTTKQLVLFLGEAEGDIILRESEILGYKWVEASELSRYLHCDTYELCKNIL